MSIALTVGADLHAALPCGMVHIDGNS